MQEWHLVFTLGNTPCIELQQYIQYDWSPFEGMMIIIIKTSEFPPISQISSVIQIVNE